MSLRILSVTLLLGVVCVVAGPVDNPKPLSQPNDQSNRNKFRQDGDGDGIDGAIDGVGDAAMGAQGFTMLAPVLGQMITGLFSGNLAQVIRAVPGTILDNSAAQTGVQTILDAVAMPFQNFVQYTFRQGQMYFNATIQRRRQAQQTAAAAAAAAAAAGVAATPSTVGAPIPVATKNSVQLDIVPVKIRSQDDLNNTQIRQDAEFHDDGFVEIGKTVGNLITDLVNGNVDAVLAGDQNVENSNGQQEVTHILNSSVNPVTNVLKFTVTKGQKQFNVTVQKTPSSTSTASDQNSEQGSIRVTVESDSL